MIKIIEPQMQRSARADRNVIRPCGLPVGKEERDRHMRIAVGRVEDAGSFVRDQRAIGKRTLEWNIAFGNGPAPSPYSFRHTSLPFEKSTTSKEPASFAIGTIAAARRKRGTGARGLPGAA